MLSFLQKNHKIGHYSGYQTRVVADFFYEITDIQDLPFLQQAYSFAQKESLPFLIIGGGTNLLFSKSRFAGVVIKNSLSGWSYDIETKILTTSSNDSIWDIAEQLEWEYEQRIWHRFIGLPGSIGWAIYGNAGCFGLETGSNFVSATVFDMETGILRTLSKEDMEFSYRHSCLKDAPHLCIIEARFDLSCIQEKYSSDVDNIFFREYKQPKGNCCGSFFKNPSRDTSAGMLIESVWLKGYHHGWAYWSDLHANFLMSDGEDCEPSDLVELVRLTQEKIQKEKGIDLINEVKII